ncbi:hypothetical protein D3C81_1158530 [compost metagenome]
MSAHGLDQVGRRADVLDFDTGDLQAPGSGRLVYGAQQALVDRIALAEHVVQLHRAEHGADVGHHQIADGVFQPAHLIGCARRIDHLIEAHRVDLHDGVVGADRFLRRDVQHALHHVDLLADAVHHWNDDVQPGLEGVGVATETFHGPFVTLWNHLEAHEDDRQGEYHEDQNDTANFHENNSLIE